ncbi:hypothetical protein Deba_2417 [Desulfarculus baarsii DSM 2075]|uniref:PBS lyase HEAT domain protein repeat-containing protein n=1 Tax=Desulfarculus baarsii (strain ATCC 33931 / DSM 2075 / LMG 7858 / VKM B-1802 / 2st14) TaxID=644282 RepID=E1QJN6_DESB2|nr:hypothetical protein [Desulfarculus baarsii]ADK85779.1 hypothetical protein Deba_2417 [Desulfarculus baarsii DSM 2075]
MQPRFDYTTLGDEQLFEMLFWAEDRLDLEAVQEIASRDSLLPYLAQVVMDKQSWLSELPEWWAVVHCSYILGLRGDDDAVLPMLAVLRWSDAFDCDWVTELLPAIFGKLGPKAIAGLTAVCRDGSAGWSARDLAMKGLAAISIDSPESAAHVFRIIGERFMDEGEDRVVRQLAGQILLDFRRVDYRLALLSFAREENVIRNQDSWYLAGFGPEDVEWAFRNPEQDLWHYQEDWMRFYDPAEVQRRQKRWSRERLGGKKQPIDRMSHGGGHVVPITRNGKKLDPPPTGDEHTDDPGSK